MSDIKLVVPRIWLARRNPDIPNSCYAICQEDRPLKDLIADKYRELGMIDKHGIYRP